jgi:hypothetical protein
MTQHAAERSGGQGARREATQSARRLSRTQVGDGLDRRAPGAGLDEGCPGLPTRGVRAVRVPGDGVASHRGRGARGGGSLASRGRRRAEGGKVQERHPGTGTRQELWAKDGLPPARCV